MERALTEADFAPHLGRTFRLDGQSLRLTFTALNSHDRPGWPAGIRKPFTLILRGPAAPILAEGVYRLTAQQGPGFVLHVIPIHTPSRDYQDYQVVFNQTAPARMGGRRQGVSEEHRASHAA